MDVGKSLRKIALRQHFIHASMRVDALLRAGRFVGMFLILQHDCMKIWGDMLKEVGASGQMLPVCLIIRGGPEGMQVVSESCILALSEE